MIDAWETLGSIGRLPSYEDLERAVLGSASAIQSLTTERDELRSRVDIQADEIAMLRVANDNLRRQLVLIGDSYVGFANSCVEQLQHVSHAMEDQKLTSEYFSGHSGTPANN
jgi:hypothetical protein